MSVMSGAEGQPLRLGMCCDGKGGARVLTISGNLLFVSGTALPKTPMKQKLSKFPRNTPPVSE
jgi:hypothetical protein